MQLILWQYDEYIDFQGSSLNLPKWVIGRQVKEPSEVKMSAWSLDSHCGQQLHLVAILWIDNCSGPKKSIQLHVIILKLNIARYIKASFSKCFFSPKHDFLFPFFHFIFVDLHLPHFPSLATTIGVLQFHINIFIFIFYFLNRLSHKVAELPQVGISDNVIDRN